MVVADYRKLGGIAHSRKRQAQGRYLRVFGETDGSEAVALAACAPLGVTQKRVDNWRSKDPWFRERYEAVMLAADGKAKGIILNARVKAALRYVGLLDTDNEAIAEKVARTILESEGILSEKGGERAGGTEGEGAAVAYIKKTYTVEELRVIVSHGLAQGQGDAATAPIVLEAEG